jgi:hypothetical protein
LQRGCRKDIGMNASLVALHRRPLAICVSILFAAASVGSAAELARAASAAHPRVGTPAVAVTNCDDDGAGSLRATIAAASSGDTIDLSALTCGMISLTTGFIGIAQDDLTLIGPPPGAPALSIDAGGTSGVLRHTGAGTLSLSDLTISNGQYTSAVTPHGGCLYSAANLSITDSTVSSCEVIGSGTTALGGGIYAGGDLTLVSSLVTGNQVHGNSAAAHGGGVYVHGNFDAEYSTISYNTTYAGPINGGRGGGAMILGTTMVRHSTIFYNGAYAVGGLYTQDAVTVDSSTIAYNGASHTAGMRAIYTTGAPTATIVNSTIANNHSVATVGGLNLIIPATITSSTIAFNSANNGLAGVLMSGPTLDLESTIIAGNVGFNVPDDFDVYGSPVISGANNLVVASSAPLPPDTIPDDPLLGLLGDNGGPTLTIPLMAASPAIDTGNNAAMLTTDQRGPGFARVFGAHADIGAFEVQPTDVIFANGFDPP